MSFAPFLLRCLLSLALLAGGVPTLPQVPAMSAESAGMTSCHDMDAASPGSHEAGPGVTDCCSGPDCLCDCLQHMPLVALVLPPLALPRLAAAPPVARSVPGKSRVPPASLRPPIA
jgi:hypothetical protein